GTSLYRVATPVILAALVMNGLWFFDQEILIPQYADKLVRRRSDIEGREAFAVWFLQDRDRSLVSANMFHPRMKEMRGVIIMRRDANDRLTEGIQADPGRCDTAKR